MRAFTLVELLVAIGIVGILIAMSFSIFQDYKDKARLAELKTVWHSVETASEVIKGELHDNGHSYSTVANSPVGWLYGSNFYTTYFIPSLHSQTWEGLLGGLADNPNYWYRVRMSIFNTGASTHHVEVFHCYIFNNTNMIYNLGTFDARTYSEAALGVSYNAAACGT